MPFSISSGLITQTGTDTNLSALGSVAGVTNITNGTKTSYFIGNNRLVVNGTLTFDPRFEEVLLGSGITAYPQVSVAVGGVLNIGIDITVNSVNFFPQCTAFVIPSFQTAIGGESADTLYSAFRVLGTCNHKYGAIYLRGPVGLGSSATVGTYKSFSKSASFISLGLAGSATALECHIRQYSNSTDINGLVTKGLWFSILGAPTQLKGLEPYQGIFAYVSSSASVSQTFVAIRDYPGNLGNLYDAAFRLPTVWMRFVNCGVGSSLVSAGNDAYSSGSNNCGIHEIRQEFTATVKDVAGSPVTSGGIYFRDRNNGNRCVYNTSFFGASQPNYTNDIEYSSAFNGSGVASITANGGVLTCVNWRNVSGLRAENNQKDYRGENNSATDNWVCRVRSYGKLFSDVSVILRGVGGSFQPVTLFHNTNVSQSSAVAQAHTGISITDHGALPVSWNSKSFGLTIVGDKSVNPSLTAGDIYHYLQYHTSQVATSFNGKLGGAWHEAILPATGGYQTVTGTYAGTRTIKGVRVIDELGNPFPGITKMQADDGTYYEPPVLTPISVSGLIAGSRVKFVKVSDGTVLYIASESAGIVNFATNTYVGAVSIEARRASSEPYYIPWVTQITTVLGQTSNVLALQQLDQ